jgi:hypothetical protein
MRKIASTLWMRTKALPHLKRFFDIFSSRALRRRETLVDEKLLSRKKADQLLSWKTSGFTLDAGDSPTLPFDREARRQFAEYMLRAPFSLEKIHWNEKTKQVIYRSKRSWHTKQNYQIFTAADFIAASVEHIPPKSQQTIRYYGRYSNRVTLTNAGVGMQKIGFTPLN